MPIARNLLLLIGVLLVACGMIVEPFGWGDYRARVIDSAVVAGVVAGLGLLVARITGLARLPAVLLVVFSLACLWLVGWAAALATVLVVTGGLSLGSLLPRTAMADPLPRWIAGLGLLAAIAGWLLPFPIHYGPTWSIALVALAWFRRRAVRADLLAFGSGLRVSIDAAPRASFACAIVLAVSTTPAWLPLLMFDDLNYHVTLLWELREFAHARFDVGTQVWAMAPWSTDVLHALVSLIAGKEAYGLLTATWLVAATLGVRSLAAQLGLSPSRAWLAAMLYASLPMSSMLTGSLQVEHATPAIFAALVLVVMNGGATRAGEFVVVAVLAGFLMATKVSNALLLVPVLAWMLVQSRGRLPWPMLPAATVLGIFAGGSSYFYSWLATGNPILPLFNGVFHSPWYMDQNFVAPAWRDGFSWNLPWRVAFETQRYFEGKAGSAGLVVLALVGGLAGLADRRWRAPLLVALVAAGLLFWQVQYLRYLQPTMVLLIPALLAALVHESGRWHWREAALSAVVLLQLALVPTASWILQAGTVRTRLLKGNDAALMKITPERVLAQRFRERYLDGDRLLFADTPFAAELPARAMGVSWHNPRLWLYLEGKKGRDPDWDGALSDSGANYVIARNAPGNRRLLAVLEERSAEIVAKAGDATLYRLSGPSQEMVKLLRDHVAFAELAVGRRRASVGEATIRMDCGNVGKNIIAYWSLSSGTAGKVENWNWVLCDVAGHARVDVRYALPPGPGKLAFSARSADPATPDPRLNISQAQVVPRHDLLRNRELADRIWSDDCEPQACDQAALELTPIE